MPNTVFILRHGERLDHMDKSWASDNYRAHDSPLTPAGVQQAYDAGENICLRLKQLQHTGKITVYVSPLLRTGQTAKAVLEQLAKHFPEEQVITRVEQGICENPLRLRLRLLGIHKDAGGADGAKDGTLLPNGEKRTVENCSPVLLSVAEVAQVLAPFDVEHAYDSQVKVRYDDECFELDDETGERTTVQERVGKCLQRFGETSDWQESPGVSILISHGGGVKSAVEYLSVRRVLLVPKEITYCHTFELSSGKGEVAVPWDVVGEWQHSSVLTVSRRIWQSVRALDSFVAQTIRRFV